MSTTEPAPPAPPAPHAYAAHLPAALRADPSLMRLVSGLGDVLEGLETAVEALGDCADPVAARTDFLPWLAGWVGMGLRADWDDTTQRTFIAEAMSLHRARGTTAGLRRILQIHLNRPREDTTIEIHDQFVDAPHFFEVSIDLSGYDQDQYNRAVEIARQIIDREKPAHTYYALKPQTDHTPLQLDKNFRLGDKSTPPLRGGT